MNATTTMSVAAEQILHQLDNPPSTSGAALQVLWMADDPDAGVADFGRAVMGDPGLTTRVMRVANSAYYGLSGRISNATFAVNVLGVQTLRAIAATVAAGITDTDALPPGFLRNSATTAVATAMVAPRVGAPVPEAHSLGLLHNMGTWLLSRGDPDGYAALRGLAAAEGVEPHTLELATYGARNGDVAAALLRDWRFPPALTEAIAAQHEPAGHPRSPLGAALFTGAALSRIVGADDPSRQIERHADALRLCKAEQDVSALLERIAAEAEQLELALRS